MSDTPTCNWQGVSGRVYKYWVHPIKTPLKAAAGNYIFAKLNNLDQWVPVYIGQTENLSERFDNHHAMPCIKRNGATHIHAHLNSDEKARIEEEGDLIAAYSTSCNIAA
ncbi:MAG TPA: GIY-YIG nuclease family protein [Xanthobacteraceae bacterium]|nr:GIY-YIG nuclease family protein [Xanthobacteraceae bacterium]